MQTASLESIKNESCLLNTLHTHFRLFKQISYGSKFFIVCTCKCNDRLQLLNSLIANAIATQLFINSINANLVKFVDCYSNVDNLISLAYSLSNTSKNLTVVNLNSYAYSKTCEYSVNNLHQLHFVEQRIRAYDIGIALIEFAIATLLRAVSTPYWLYLITLERQLNLITMLNNVACKRNCQIIAQTFLAKFCCKMKRITLHKLIVREFGEIIARIEHFEEQLVALLAILAHQCR